MKNRFESREILCVSMEGINPSGGGFGSVNPSNNVTSAKGITPETGVAGVASIKNIEALSLAGLSQSGLVLRALS